MTRAGTDLNTGERFNPVAGLSEGAFQQAVANLARACGWRVAHFRPVRVSVEIALARASGRAAVGVVAPDGQRCGQLHAGHLEPCPFDAFECDLPAVGVEGSQP